MKVENHIANELLIAARKAERTQEFMEVVSGVSNYKLHVMERQGIIRSMFSKELISEQFLLEFEEIVSVFWHGVFEHLDKAKLFGEMVEIKAPGKKKERRPTDNNPIHYLRYHGRMAVRNYITSLYRRNLQQGCSTCGYRTSIKNDKYCPKCKSAMSTVYKFEVIDDDNNQFHDSVDKSEHNDMIQKIDKLLIRFCNEVLGVKTRAYQVMQILINPEASRQMCAECGLCDAETFDIDTCTNYNANIGNWLGVNKTMIASKMRRIRKALPEFLKSEGSDEATYLLGRIHSKYKSLKIIDD
jgi:Zn finger protein HypA/HybF involved in hydrogenase expression